MGQITATVLSAVDSRVYECQLPDDEQLSLLAARLAEALRFPVVGPDNYPLTYGFVVKNGGLLSPEAALGELDLPEPLILRLVPEVCANSENATLSKGLKPRQRTMFSPIKVTEITPFHPTPAVSGFDVWLDDKVHREIEIYARQREDVERAGLLMGSVEEHNNQKIIHIKAAIFAEEADGSSCSVRFTLKAWGEVLRIRDELYSSLKVLGWFHTHPQRGVFMSESDMFIHSRLFDDYDMVAYVLDPGSERDAFFRWREGLIVPCASYGLACSAATTAQESAETEAKSVRWKEMLQKLLKLH